VGRDDRGGVSSASEGGSGRKENAGDVRGEGGGHGARGRVEVGGEGGDGRGRGGWGGAGHEDVRVRELRRELESAQQQQRALERWVYTLYINTCI
jgi:hypothetical protein